MLLDMRVWYCHSFGTEFDYGVKLDELARRADLLHRCTEASQPNRHDTRCETLEA